MQTTNELIITPTFTIPNGRFMKPNSYGKSFPNIARAVKQARINIGVSQEFLAKNIEYKNGQFVSNIERGLCSIPEDRIKPMSKILGIHEDILIGAMIEDFRFNIKESLKV